MIYLALLSAVILRVYKIFSNYYFTGELGKELLYVRDIISTNTIPLVGLTTSHEWLTYGPFYYWILTPLVKVFGGDPFILFWLALVVSILGIALTHLVFKKIVGERFAIILTFFVSLSPIWIWIARLSKLHTFFFILIPLSIYFLHRIWQKDIKKIFWLGTVFGLPTAFIGRNYGRIFP